MSRIIHWFRRDLRISDNAALYSACQEAAEVIPVYIVSTWKRIHVWTGANRQEFLSGCLASLAKNLEQIGGRLIVRSGAPVQELMRLAKETRSGAIYFSENYSPDLSRYRDYGAWRRPESERPTFSGVYALCQGLAPPEKAGPATECEKVSHPW